ncbi:HTH-type transcriptional regulator / antitoxin HigA [Candidatus Nitrotoga sp. HW29]|uniref:ImmA/IrrE family metallo-endopeptidase n=1 Tax=Candidatus Nitrotoga sp. HW29 TaxID=2886963 RepID=UPI000E3B440E|nr:ImmA/IrrE family metallo-endopeptidase [Candidatus Nitrotoga sp. HW29]RFC31718.1 MAG: HTH-type transcriptional regulator / antitoxin HigA [Candidatus Nitrotoga sp. SPKER]CAH1904645.1 HTH-type transcriptional regulator / antitoxin HigA [Candidatus Nitrotoga sp. HW29]
MNIKVIKSNNDYAQAMARFTALMTLDPKDGSKEDNELELLALVIEDYERKIVPPVVPDPVEAILFRMDQMKLGRKELEPYIGSISKVSEVLSRKRPLSLSMIRRLHKGLGIPADVLIGGAESNQTAIGEEPEMEYTKLPLKEMLERGCFGEFKGNAQRLKDYAEDLALKFMYGLLPKQAEPAFLRAPLHQRGTRGADGYALLAWRLCVIKKARANPAPREYKKGVITAKWLKDLARLSAFEDGPRLAREQLGMAGITLVIEPHFKGTYLDGAAMLDEGRPVVAMTLRHDRLDNFWFVLMHELAHVAKHLDEAHPLFTDDLDSLVELDRIEREADDIAGEALIPQTAWQKSAARTSHLTTDVVALAEKLGVHPAIVAGRVRHETKNFRLLARQLGQGQASRHFA